jgi:hypothetical protein
MTRFLTIIGLAFALTTSASARQAGDLPFAHTHSSSCGSTGGVCYGYAMGRAAGAGAGEYSACDAATIVPSNCENWSAWYVNSTYWQSLVADPHLDHTGGAIVKFTPEGGGAEHVAYMVLAPGRASYQLDHIRNAGGNPTTADYAYKQTDGRYKLTMPGGVYYSAGYYLLSSFNVQAENKFYTSAGADSTHGIITIAGTSDTSPVTVSLPWTGSYTATATDDQEYPTGCRQSFNTQIGWRLGAQSIGTTLAIPIAVGLQVNKYQAHFYQKAQVTFVPSGGGGIQVDGGTWSGSHSVYARINPAPADNLDAQAIDGSGDNFNFMFTSWTNNVNGNTVYTPSLSFTPTSPITYTAHFVDRPHPPSAFCQVGAIGQYVQLTWNDNPDTRITKYHLRRRSVSEQKHLVAEIRRGVQTWTDYEVTVKGIREGPEIVYEISSVDTLTGNEGDESSVNQFGQYEQSDPRIAVNMSPDNDGMSSPIEFSVGNYPNPFNPSTTISFSVPENSSVRLEVFDIAGRRTKSLIDGAVSAGCHSIVWNGKDEKGGQVPSGTYLYRFTAAPTIGSKAYAQSGKLVLTK